MNSKSFYLGIFKKFQLINYKFSFTFNLRSYFSLCS